MMQRRKNPKKTSVSWQGIPKEDSVPFGTRLSVESLVCYTFIRKPAARQQRVLR